VDIRIFRKTYNYLIQLPFMADTLYPKLKTL
jgi:hypothetical protein